jgi:cytochrome c peroxidase
MINQFSLQQADANGFWRTLPIMVMAALLCACGGGSSSNSTANSSNAPAAIAADPALPARLGEKIFNDQSLSASGKQACSTCHDPLHAHAQPNALAVQLGGKNLDQPGFRAAPSLRYLNTTPNFFFAADGSPTGGFDRDGRVQTLAAQAERPFLAAHEMANASRADVVNSLKRSAYAAEFQTAFGAAIFDRPDDAFERALFALQQFQLQAPEFHPFDSKYDQFLAGKASLSDAELRGLSLFNDAKKGNCGSCHLSAKGADGSPPLFTDFTFDNLGVPRNPAIPATADSGYFDLGLCGPDRNDLAQRADLCGAFKVPSLRNVTTRQVFFHNGRFTSLRDAIGFYVRRDTNPEEWYPRDANGQVQKFNDVPPQYSKNINTSEAPYNRKPGMAPALSEAEIEDVMQFLSTLTDGYRTK